MKPAIKEKITLQNMLCLFIIICPILDIVSFLFRNAFGTSKSPSTFLRPIIPVIIFVYLFFKKNMKKKMILISVIYGLYAIIHLYIFSVIRTQASYGGILLEAQHIANYTFMILTFFVYTYCFKEEESTKLRKSVIIAGGIAIISILISIITNTSSTTYIEGIGKKGWFESGNSLGAMLALILFIILPLIHNKKYRYITIGIVTAISIYLAFFIGTRVGLLGTIAALFVFCASEILEAILHRIQLNKYILIGGIIALVLIVVVVLVVGSTTFARRKLLKEIAQNNIDSSTNQVAHMSQSLLELKNTIKDGTMTEQELSKPAQKSILELYDYANTNKVESNDMRTQQLIYNLYLVKNQANPILLLFGNGYNANFRELVLEMEIIAFLLNYGICGFILYFVPFLGICLYGIIQGIKYRRKIDVSYVMTQFGCLFSYALGIVSGYVFFNVSTMIMIVILHTMLLKQAQNLKK